MIKSFKKFLLVPKVIQDTAYVTAGMIVSRVLLFARDFLVARIMGPENYGIWVRINLILNYALKSPLGFEDTMTREGPYFRGQNEQEKVDEVRSITLSVTLLMAVIVAVILVIEAWISGGSKWLFIDLRTTMFLGVLIICQQIFGFYSVATRNRRGFASFGVGMIISAAVAFIFTIILANIWDVLGIIISLAIGYFITIAFWHLQGDFYFQKAALSWSTFKRMLRIAIPLFGVGITTLLHTTVDRIMVARFLTNTELGYYGLAILIVSSLTMITYPISTVTSPRLFASYGQTQEDRQIRQNVIMPILATAYLSAVFVGIIWLTLDSIVSLYLPQYLQGVQAAQIISIHAYFLATPIAGGMLLTAADKQNLFLLIRVAMLIISFGLIWLVINLIGTLTSIAIATSVSSFLYCSTMLIVTDQQLASDKQFSLNLIIRSCFPLVYVGFSVFLVELMVGTRLSIGLIRTTTTTAIFLVLTGLLALCFYREMQKER